MRKTLATAAAVAGMIGAFAAAPSAVGVENPDAPSPYARLAPSSKAPPAAGSASASAVSSLEMYFVSQSSGTCLDDSAANGLRTHTCSAASFNNGYQKWVAVRDTNGYYQFMNDASKECLDGSANYGLRTHGCSGASFDNGYQMWVLYTWNTDRTRVSWKNMATGTCMDNSSANGLRLHTCSVASFQNNYQAWVHPV